ncbi:transcriptional regulator [Alteromonas sp. KC3]|uniref:LysR family transcriptional regulator n=1 Tax=unclassified Alteromonas TaxID=2614992 RepID=UPI001922BE2C|nr:MULTISPECIES: LysR family transcriptional regulator [unclassified Alteromonas]BCO17881.1 transcriptional regulator [Alteromonas sp. KC3]BCO21842.1 transcriptional regulator [Alteromonas sp. KC14]
MNRTHVDLAKLVQSAPLLAAIHSERSFTKAAEKLGIDQSAVSHRVKSIEASIGFALFSRTTRQLALTDAGRILCEAATSSVDLWTQALAQLERINKTEQIQLSVSSSLAMKWLIKTLPSAKQYGVSVALNVDDELVEFEQSGIDAAIRFGVGPFPGHYAVRISKCALQPVVSPHYASSILQSKEESSTLLLNSNTVFLADRKGEHDKTQYNWETYIKKAKLSIDHFGISYEFDRADLLLQSVISGLGVGLGRTLLIEDDINRGFLKPIGKAVSIDASYWLVCSANFAQTERFENLQRWLRSLVCTTN